MLINMQQQQLLPGFEVYLHVCVCVFFIGIVIEESI